MQTYTHSMIVYKGQGIDWHPQSDSLGVSPLKWTHSTHPFVSDLCRLVEGLRQLTCFIGCFIRIRLWHSPYPFQSNHPHSHTSQCVAPFPLKLWLEALTWRVHSVPITFHRTLRAFISAISNTTGEQLDHLYIARVELTHGTALPVREHWEEVVQEPVVVENIPPGPECEEIINLLSPATRFLRHLEEDLVPLHFDFTVDSDGDHLFPHSLTQTVAHTLRLGNLEPLLTPVTQISAIPEERDPNNDTPAPDPPASELLPGQWLLHGESLERWLEADLHPDLVVLRPFDGTGHILGKYKRQREEPEQEEAPRKKRTCKQYRREICWQENDNPTPIISKCRLHPQAPLKTLCKYL